MIFTAFALLFDLADKVMQLDYFRQKLLENVKILLLLEFISNTYTFGFFIEVILVFGLTVLGMMKLLAETEKEHQNLARFLDRLIGFLGFLIISNALGDLKT